MTTKRAEFTPLPKGSGFSSDILMNFYSETIGKRRSLISSSLNVYSASWGSRGQVVK